MRQQPQLFSVNALEWALLEGLTRGGPKDPQTPGCWRPLSLAPNGWRGEARTGTPTHTLQVWGSAALAVGCQYGPPGCGTQAMPFKVSLTLTGLGTWGHDSKARPSITQSQACMAEVLKYYRPFKLPCTLIDLGRSGVQQNQDVSTWLHESSNHFALLPNWRGAACSLGT